MVSLRHLEDIKKLITEGKHFCIVPWVHLYVTGLGHMSECYSIIEGSNSTGYGSLNNNSFDELWQGEKIRSFRKRLLNDEMIPECAQCYKNEKAGCYSLRKDVNEKFKEYIAWVANTDDNGYANDAKPISWDIRFSNLCNLKCRTCCYSSSSSWYNDQKALGLPVDELTNSDSIIKGVNDSGKLLKDLDKYIPHLKKIYFAGGEPLIIKENYEILEKLNLLKLYDIEITYNTNLTVLGHLGLGTIKLWKNFNNIKLFASADGSFGRGEYIRKNILWNEFESNVHFIKQECRNLKFTLTSTVSVFNILHLTDFHRQCVESGLIGIDEIWLSILNMPEFYSIKILTPELKIKATGKIEKHIEWLKSQCSPEEYINSVRLQELIRQFEVCINYLNSEDWTDKISEFKKYTDKLDELRKESFVEVFPELESLYTSLKGDCNDK
ncbi:MAG TPA: twitch domain-containing radical SAM protein [Clostridia bacterium]